MIDDADHRHHALDAVDAVVGNLGPLPAPVAAMLFQSEVAAAARGAPSLAFSASVRCPKIGILATTEGDRNPLTAPLPDKHFSCMEAVAKQIHFDLGVTGQELKAEASVDAGV